MSSYLEIENLIIDIVNHRNRGSELDPDILYNFYMGQLLRYYQ